MKNGNHAPAAQRGELSGALQVSSFTDLLLEVNCKSASQDQLLPDSQQGSNKIGQGPPFADTCPSWPALPAEEGEPASRAPSTQRAGTGADQNPRRTEFQAAKWRILDTKSSSQTNNRILHKHATEQGNRVLPTVMVQSTMAFRTVQPSQCCEPPTTRTHPSHSAFPGLAPVGARLTHLTPRQRFLACPLLSR